MPTWARSGAHHRGRLLALGRSLVRVVLLASLALGFLPCTRPCSLGPDGHAGPPGLTRLRICRTADAAFGSLADQSLLRSEALVPLTPPPVRSVILQVPARLPEGYTQPVERPPRVGA